MIFSTSGLLENRFAWIPACLVLHVRIYGYSPIGGHNEKSSLADERLAESDGGKERRRRWGKETPPAGGAEELQKKNKPKPSRTGQKAPSVCAR